MSVIKSTKLYSPEEYVEALTGRYYYFAKDDTVEEIHKYLKYNEIENETRPIFDYPLDEIEEIIEQETQVVLVDVSYIDEDYELIHEYRWFEVPDYFDERRLPNRMR